MKQRKKDSGESAPLKERAVGVASKFADTHPEGMRRFAAIVGADWQRYPGR